MSRFTSLTQLCVRTVSCFSRMTSAFSKDQKTLPTPAKPKLAVLAVIPPAPTNLTVGTMVDYDGEKEHFIAAVYYLPMYGWVCDVVQFPNCDTSDCKRSSGVNFRRLKPTKELGGLFMCGYPWRLTLLTDQFRNRWNALMSYRMKRFEGKKRAEDIRISDKEVEVDDDD